jgi:hypothetical protein
VRGVSEFTAEAVGALGDLGQDPVGGGEVVWVEADVNALGDGGGQIGVGGGAFGGELGSCRKTSGCSSWLSCWVMIEPGLVHGRPRGRNDKR